MEKIIDESALDRLLEVIGGDREDLQNLLDEFQSTTPVTLTKLQDAARTGDLDQLRIDAHSLKSNGRDFGATRLADLCERLERDCRDGEVAEPEARVSAIADDLEAARAALRALSVRNE